MRTKICSPSPAQLNKTRTEPALGSGSHQRAPSSAPPPTDSSRSARYDYNSPTCRPSCPRPDPLSPPAAACTRNASGAPAPSSSTSARPRGPRVAIGPRFRVAPFGPSSSARTRARRIRRRLHEDRPVAAIAPSRGRRCSCVLTLPPRWCRSFVSWQAG